MLIPNINDRQRNKTSKPNFHLTQFLTGHDNFGEYLKKYNITDNDKYINCNSEITNRTDHAFVNCTAIHHIMIKYNINHKNLFKDKINTSNSAEYVNQVMKNKLKID